MENSILINSVDRIDHLHSLVRQDLRELGVKLPKSKKVRKLNQSFSADECFNKKLFGNYLQNCPSVFLRNHGDVPRFLIEAAKLIEVNINCEGIFRKSGSLSRQKEIRHALECGKSLDKNLNIHDLTVLIKQFFRDLPEPVFTSYYNDAFIKCFQLPTEKEPLKAMLQLCLLLPLPNIGVLRFILHLMAKVAAHSDKNKMTAENLAVVLTPNLMHSNKTNQKMSSHDEKMLTIQTSVVGLLIKHHKEVGMVGVHLQQQLQLMAECFTTDDDLDASDDNTLEDSQEMYRKKKRKRSGSLTGIVNSIASSFAKLRRSTDGKGFNSSSVVNHTYAGELSFPNTTIDQSSHDPLSTTTPCVMRKRRASGETVAFSATKKKAILENLHQKSALASTPFTPASTVKKSHREGISLQDPVLPDLAATPRLSETSPAPSSKTPKIKLNLFGSPSVNKKFKRAGSIQRLSSTNPIDGKSSKKKGFFRRISGGRVEKDIQEIATTVEMVGEKLALTSSTSKPPLDDSICGLLRSVSSPTLKEKSEDDQILLNKGFICDSDIPDNTESVSVQLRSTRGRAADLLINRSKSADSPLKIKIPDSIISNGLTPKKKKGKLIDKSLISEPVAVIVPVVPGVDIQPDRELRRSRRDSFEEKMSSTRIEPEGNSDETGGIQTETSNLHKNREDGEESFMETVFKPPPGFGDQTMLQAHEEDNECMSEAGFSTISGNTVLQKTFSGNYINVDGDHGMKPSISKDSLLSTDSYVSSVSSSGGSSRTVEVDEGMYVSLRPDSHKHSYVTLKQAKDVSALTNKYKSDESVRVSRSENAIQDLGTLVSESMASHIHRKKSVSAEDLGSPKVLIPKRPHSVNNSPRKFNFKPHLEITRDTHNMLTRAGYLNPCPGALNIDVEVPVRSPKRSKEREEMIAALRFSFREKPSLNRSRRRSNSENQDSKSTSAVSEDVFHRSKSVESKTEENMIDAPNVVDLCITSPGNDNPTENFHQNIATIDECSPSSEAINVRSPSSEAINDKNLNENKAQSSNDDDKFIEPKSRKLKSDKLKEMTLSGFLDTSLLKQGGALKIKRAAITLPKHDSIVNISQQNAGSVAENVNYFHQKQQNQKITGPLVQKRGKSPVRIPTIFAKTEEKRNQYVEIANSLRERLSSKEMEDLRPEESMDCDANSSIETFTDDEKLSSDNRSVDCVRTTVSSVPSILGEPPELSHSLIETINDLCTPNVATTPVKSCDKNNQVKSPLLESTNTASVTTPGKKLNTKIQNAGATPRRILSLDGPARLGQKQVKRLGSSQPHRRTAPKSPHRARPSPKRLKSPKQEVSLSLNPDRLS